MDNLGITIRRGGVQFGEADEGIVAIGGWCAPSTDLAEMFAEPTGPFEPIPPCDGVNHRWERVGSYCHECHQAVPPRRLECEACDAELREDADGLPAGHFDRLWAVAPC